MTANRARRKERGVFLLIVAAGVLAAGCWESTPPQPEPEGGRARRRRPRRRTFRYAAATAPATSPAPKPAEKPAPWTKVRKISLEESFAFFKKLQRVATARVPRAPEAPKLDGVLDEAYKRAPPLKLRFLDGRAGGPAAPTTVHLLSTDKELFVFYDCRSPDMGALRATVTQRDGQVWGDDSVEMFLDVANARRANSYVHIILNPLGTVADSDRALGDAGAKWNAKLRVKARVGKKGWSVEVAVPFADLYKDSRSINRVWAANFNRMARLPKGGEDTAWCPTGGTDSHQPAYFGLLWLDAGNVYADYSRWAGPRHVYRTPGKPVFRFTDVAAEKLAECTALTPNADGSYWFGTGPKGRRDLLILTEQKAVRVSSLHAWCPIRARWLNAKLLYISRQADDQQGYYCIYDVEREKVLVEETESDGTEIWRRISEAGGAGP